MVIHLELTSLQPTKEDTTYTYLLTIGTDIDSATTFTYKVLAKSRYSYNLLFIYFIFSKCNYGDGSQPIKLQCSNNERINAIVSSHYGLSNDSSLDSYSIGHTACPSSEPSWDRFHFCSYF